MDQFVKTKLTSIKCENFIPKFEANEIDEGAFMLLTHENLRELIPSKIGPQIKILSLIQKLKSAQNPESPTQFHVSSSAGPSGISTNNTNGNESAPSFQCQKCTMKFTNGTMLVEHLKLVHREPRYSTKFTCPNCKAECQIHINFR